MWKEGGSSVFKDDGGLEGQVYCKKSRNNCVFQMEKKHGWGVAVFFSLDSPLCYGCTYLFSHLFMNISSYFASNGFACTHSSNSRFWKLIIWVEICDFEKSSNMAPKICV